MKRSRMAPGSSERWVQILTHRQQICPLPLEGVVVEHSLSRPSEVVSVRAFALPHLTGEKANGYLDVIEITDKQLKSA